MSETQYKLSCTLVGHKLDVRSLTVTKDGNILSASRDKTARIWKPSGDGKTYVEAAVLKGHNNFVSSVCILESTEKYTSGVIITGSNDSNICLYTPGENEPFFTFKAHQNTVCNLRASEEKGHFLSSSWDMTAKLWNINDVSNPKVTFIGHTAAVWCVLDIKNALMIITGSADKLVIVWSRNGIIKHKLTGHTDCVRDIVGISDDEFLTCANDATVRHWNASQGICLGTYDGHTNYIYSISATPGGEIIATSGEDRSLRIWQKANIKQTIYLPPQSIWSSKILPNGDIVTGASDGVLRIFSTNLERQADAQVLQTFEEEVASVQLNAQQELGGLKISELPDSTALFTPGRKDGQTKMVREGSNVVVYSWSAGQQQWKKIGDVMGATGGSAATSGKQLYNGIEYDYVFSVDIEEGSPPLKLPYNIGQDPWHVAQKFIHDNELSQLFLDQVANFIVKNSQAAPVLNTTAQYTDPFTGGSRYIPTSNAPSTEQKIPIASSSNSSVGTIYIPRDSYLKLEQANLTVIFDKLREFNAKRDSMHQALDDKLESVVKLAGNDSIIPGSIDILKGLLDWTNDIVFPALDIARLAVLRKEVNDELCNEDLMEVVRRHINANSLQSNQMLSFRLLANMFSHKKGEKLGLEYRDEILKCLLNLPSLGNKNNQVSIATYVLNLTVALNKHNDTSGKTRAMNVILSMIPRLQEPEAIFRILVGLGTLLDGTNDVNNRNELIEAVRQSEVALTMLRTLSEDNGDVNSQNKLASCSKQIINLLF
ncbi:phospholipase A-2-activating protein [Leptopilina boulardi]|uniref:phospholipase A-2-activating protein n=1 Tax=Leptopilina boulardi TaxID=63433 RepID=UPI0021F535E9|nr:phospholipase A-2-activating protein [Leptopilina boulardi]